MVSRQIGRGPAQSSDSLNVNSAAPRSLNGHSAPRSNTDNSSNGLRRVHVSIETLLARFEAYLRQHSLSPTTIRNYLADLRFFARWHRESHPRVLRLRADDFSAYRDHLCNDTHHSPATVNRRLQSLRLFGRFLHENGQIAENPSSSIQLLHSANGNGAVPRTLTDSEIALLHNAVRSGRPSLALRDLAIVQLMLQAGLRVHEVAGLRLRDLVHTGRGMKADVRGNPRATPRTVPLNAIAARAVRDYMAVRPAIPRVEHLFVSQRGQPLSMRSIQRMIDLHARAAGLENVCAQSLRHTCAKTMLEHTQDTALVARWLGHRSTRILGKYHFGDSPDEVCPPGRSRRLNGN